MKVLSLVRVSLCASNYGCSRALTSPNKQIDGRADRSTWLLEFWCFPYRSLLSSRHKESKAVKLLRHQPAFQREIFEVKGLWRARTRSVGEPFLPLHKLSDVRFWAGRASISLGFRLGEWHPHPFTTRAVVWRWPFFAAKTSSTVKLQKWHWGREDSNTSLSHEDHREQLSRIKETRCGWWCWMVICLSWLQQGWDLQKHIFFGDLIINRKKT